MNIQDFKYTNFFFIQILCTDTNSGMCYTPQEVENIKYNYRLEQMERAFNFSEILGETFIDDCDALRPYEDEIVSVRVY